MHDSLNAAVVLLAPNLARHPDKAAILTSRFEVSYRELDELSSRFGSLLHDSGVRPGERVVIAAGDSPEYIYALLGCLKHGAVPVLVNTGLFPSDYQYVIRDCEAVALITDTMSDAVLQHGSEHIRLTVPLDENLPDSLEKASRDLVPFSPSGDDIAFLLYSSGSTGEPKGVPHRHGDLIATADAYGGTVVGMGVRDVVFSASKLSFAYGLGNSFSFPFRFGATVVLHPGKPDSAEILRIIARYGVTVFFGVPVVYNMILKTMEAVEMLASLRLCVSAGEALPAPVYREWKEATGIELIDGIGSTEALHIYISNRPDSVRPGTAGRLIPPYDVRIIDDEEQPVRPGTPGHLHLRGPSIAPFYWNRPDKTHELMHADGWFRTGDIFVEDNGWYTYLGRYDDMFKVDAHWVSPSRVEAVLREHPAVSECALSWRTVESLVRPIAFAVLSHGFEPEPKLERELRRFVARKLPAYMCPVQIEWVAELPRTATGKIQRFKLHRSGK
jgi:benzoate-CoA ligase